MFIDGFDFGTTKEQVESHCSQAGEVISVALKKGNAVVKFSSPDEAKAAVESLNKSTIEGNSRFIDVKLDKKSLPPKAGTKRPKNSADDSCKVFVRGFDFDTTDEAFEAHVSGVGTIEDVNWITKGSAVVTYSSPSEASAAVKTLQGTTIPGNSRFIDVLPKDEGERPAKKKIKSGMPATNAGMKGQWGIPAMNAGMKGQWVFVPATNGGKQGKQTKPKKGGRSEDPAGCGRVYVRGFDFETTDDQLETHMKKAGAVHAVKWITKGSAVVIYMKKASAVKAVSTLNQTTLKGNTRYIDVILKDD